MAGETSIGRRAVRLAARAGVSVIVALIETFIRLRSLLDHRTYAIARRVRGLSSVGHEASGGDHMIFLTVVTGALPEFTLRALRAFSAAGVNITLVVNGRVTEPLRECVKECVFQILERENVGRDFGGYKDGILSLLDQARQGKITLGRVLIANDSVYYFERGLQEMVSRLLASDAGFTGACESDEFAYHIQSYLVLFSREVVASGAFCRYWEQYLPLNSRQWAIQQGEIALSKTLTKAGFSPDVLYSVHALRAKLAGMSEADLVMAAGLVPRAIQKREKLRPQRLMKSSLDTAAADVDIHARWATGLSSLAGFGSRTEGEANAGALREYMSVERRAFSSVEVLNGAARVEMIRSIADAVTSGSQTHFGGLLFMQALDMPILKRDMVYRGLYPSHEIVAFLESLREPCAHEVSRDLRRKGVATWLRGFQRALHRRGLI